MTERRSEESILSLGYSTCPNDTLGFYALAHGRVDTGGLNFRIELGDVELLNQKARRVALDVTKLSFAALGNLLDNYGLLRSGAALGRGCGPLVVARPGIQLDALEKGPVAVPGMWTTAAMLLGLYVPGSINPVPMRFEAIMPKIMRGELDIGVIIHEGRFTYREYGLECLLDLGEWWESLTGKPIPLGCIAARRDLPPEKIRKIETGIRESVRYGLANRNEAMAYISRYSQEMAPAVIGQHIDLYVNDFTVDLGVEGAAAVRTLFEMAAKKGLLSGGANDLFF
jgi:1,4-dihydroxy-6-naphthoate synthase